MFEVHTYCICLLLLHKIIKQQQDLDKDDLAKITPEKLTPGLQYAIV